MNTFELDSGFEVLPSDDQYIGYKEAYKHGKQHYLEYKHTREEIMYYIVYCTKHKDESREHFINGWLYQQWVEKNEQLQRMSLLRDQREI